MRYWLSFFCVLALSACVDPVEIKFSSVLNVLVVDATLTNLDEPQVIRLLRSKADPITGRPGTFPVTGAKAELVVDSTQLIPFGEAGEGRYQAPQGFKGLVGHAYQLRLTLSDGSRYESDQQLMPTVAPVTRVYHRFNSTSLPAQRPDGTANLIRGASDVFVDWQDPAQESNHYRWEWTLWEKQDWCHSCVQGSYSVYNVIPDPNIYGLISVGNTVVERCYYPPPPPPGFAPIDYFVFDYRCRTPCWEILYSYDLNIFADTYTNGNMNTGRRVAQIPFNDHNPCLVAVRQASLTQQAYNYYKTLEDQTERTGGLADTPPSPPVGNVRNVGNSRETVVGYFTASAVAEVRYWLDRRDSNGTPPGLFRALNGREPNTEPPLPSPVHIYIQYRDNKGRPPTAPCLLSDGRTPFKPEGWRD